MPLLGLLLGPLLGLACGCVWAQTSPPTPPPAIAIKGQTTWVWQAKPAFYAAYSGDNSLSPLEERSYSFTATADIGLRLWSGAQLHINPEAAAGVPLSNLTGAGGLSNAELARTSGPHLTGYRARIFVAQSWNLNNTFEKVDADFNELGGLASTERLSLVVGNFSLLDYFDNNPYAKDPRSQFFNWAHMTYGAWDFAADSRGYTQGAMLEYRTPAWSLRFARAAQPVESNGLALNPNFNASFGDQIELESDLPLATAAGPLRASALIWRNQAIMGAYSDALALGGTPDLSKVRKEQIKVGWGLTLMVPTGQDAGVFVRASANDGSTETYAFTEIDRQLATGVQLNGRAWSRGADRFGVALAVNDLNGPHKDYLAAGGKGFFLGDGRLTNYASERVVDTWYRWALPDWGTRLGNIQSTFTLGWQLINNPAYNADRGPVQVYSIRWHSEF